jgi:protein CMS1
MTTTGGDDLESDDEYLDQNWGKSEPVSVSLDVSSGVEDNNKRGLAEIYDDSIGPDDDDVAKKQKQINPRSVMLEAGRGIASESLDVQAQFLWACITNSLKLRGEEIPEKKLDASCFIKKDANKQSNKNELSKYDPSLAKFLKGGVISSAKRLKKWRHNKCPMVLVICASAKRAVSLLKEISTLNVRAAKLFAKHMTIADQTAMLENNKYSIAVGTPNRLLKLIEENDDTDTDEAPLNLDQTELIIIDCHEDKKRYTVCTMNDTAPDLMMFMKEAVIPQIGTRKSLKIAFF